MGLKEQLRVLIPLSHLVLRTPLYYSPTKRISSVYMNTSSMEDPPIHRHTKIVSFIFWQLSVLELLYLGQNKLPFILSFIPSYL